jgi:hypothetical protein
MLRALVLATSALLVGLASPAWADKDKDKGGKGKHGQGRGGPAVVVQPVRVVVPDHDRAIVYQYYRSEYSAGRCPPGLAKKGNGCLPPGQAKQQQLWVIGQPLPHAIVYERVPPTVVQQLAPVPPGYEYVRVDNDVLLMDMTNRMVADVVNDLGDYDSLGLD